MPNKYDVTVPFVVFAKVEIESTTKEKAIAIANESVNLSELCDGSIIGEYDDNCVELITSNQPLQNTDIFEIEAKLSEENK